MLPPITKTARIHIPIEEVFEYFTLGMGNWWPVKSHSVAANSGAVPQELHFETQLGGKIYEVLPDGSHATWGTVTLWEPPEKLTFSWHPGKDPALSTKVTLQLSRLGSHTEILLTHEGWEVLGKAAKAQHAQYDPGWDFVFGECFLSRFN